MLIDLPVNGPGQVVPRSEFRAIITANRLRLAVAGDRPFEHARDTAAGKTGRHFQRQALAGKAIDHAQHPESLAGGGHVAG